MSLAKLKKKYDYRKPPAVIAKPIHDHELKSWQDSAPISRLIVYLNEHGKESGMRLRRYEGRPCLSFDPGITVADMKTGRWQVAMNAVYLMQQASKDMMSITAKGLECHTNQ